MVGGTWEDMEDAEGVGHKDGPIEEPVCDEVEDGWCARDGREVGDGESRRALSAWSWW